MHLLRLNCPVITRIVSLVLHKGQKISIHLKCHIALQREIYGWKLLQSQWPITRKQTQNDNLSLSPWSNKRMWMERLPWAYWTFGWCSIHRQGCLIRTRPKIGLMPTGGGQCGFSQLLPAAWESPALSSTSSFSASIPHLLYTAWHGAGPIELRFSPETYQVLFPRSWAALQLTSLVGTMWWSMAPFDAFHCAMG